MEQRHEMLCGFVYSGKSNSICKPLHWNPREFAIFRLPIQIFNWKHALKQSGGMWVVSRWQDRKLKVVSCISYCESIQKMIVHQVHVWWSDLSLPFFFNLVFCIPSVEDRWMQYADVLDQGCNDMDKVLIWPDVTVLFISCANGCPHLPVWDRTDRG